MKVFAHESLSPQTVTMPGAERCQVRWLVSERDGAPNFAMRQFEVAAGGFTPKHSHPYEHEVFVLSGEGIVLEGDREHAIRAGDVVYIAPDEIHQFRSMGPGSLKFLCLVPNSSANLPVTLAAECAEPASRTR
jgi:quercetin dioxygenase-like cupin family protein